MSSEKIKYIIVVGSIMSGLGKGIVTASIGKLLQARGYKVSPIKFDGYLNVDCGTMNPFRHGEVFVLDDGTEVDMDFGTYERFLNQSISGENSITGGKLFQKIIEKERRGDYLGRDVQFVPHLTDEIKKWVRNVGKKNDSDVVIVEVGGTVGDLENSYFLEAMRQLGVEETVLFAQLTFLPSLSEGEQKTKPTQHATRLLQSVGINPDIILCRGNEKLSDEARKKLALYCNLKEEFVFDDPTLNTIYELPLLLEKQDLYNAIAEKLKLEDRKPDLKEWKEKVERIIKPKNELLKIAVVGKYTAVKDAYISVKEALVHSAAEIDHGLEIEWVEASDLEKMDKERMEKKLSIYDGILVPGGFGERGIEGKILAIKYARENKVPYLGLCLGLQLMVVEYSRNVCNLKDSHSTEFSKETKYPVIDFLPEQKQIAKMGASMRLGAYSCDITEGTVTKTAYNKKDCSERHRHRYEVNPDFVDEIKKFGLVFAGFHKSARGDVTEIVEWPSEYGFGIATQAHIELKSRLEAPAPIIVEYMKAAAKRKKEGK